MYDGPSTASPLLASYAEGTYTGSVTFTATTGCLTFSLVVANPVNNGDESGWEASFNCIAGCIPGCTDPAALNYNSSATYDDGSCTYPAPDYSMSTAGINGEYVGNCLVADCGPSSFTDDGGFAGNYSNSINQIYRVFCPEIAGNCMRVTFNDVDFYNTLDYLTIKNGPTQNSTDIDQITSTDNGTTPFSYTSSDPSGCLTFRQNTSSANVAGGWSAILECVPCAGGPSGTENYDCVNMTPLCSSASVGGNASGPGLSAEGCTGSDCPAGGENHTNWYTFTAQTSGTLNITIAPAPISK